MQNRDEEIGRKGGVGTTGSTMQRGDRDTGDKMKEGWSDFKLKVKQKWNQLTNDDEIDRYQGRSRNDFVGYVHGRVGGDRGTVERDIDNYSRETNYRWNQ